MTVKFVTFSNLIIDDIVLPDGRTYMNTLGGAGTHALVGMRVWSDQLGYVASVGPDFDPSLREALARFGVDLQGIAERRAYRTARAWQLFEIDERRIEIFRTSPEDFNEQKPVLADLPDDYRRATGFHIQWGTLDELEQLVTSLRSDRPTIRLIWETSPAQLMEPGAHFARLLSLIDVFSPDTEEAAQITGQTEPNDMITSLLDMGARAIALRMGARGSIVAADTGERWNIPAVATTIVDVTGAGNSYCGGFLTGLGDDLPLPEAALRGAVSASFALEQFGLPEWGDWLTDEAEQRLDWARQRLDSAPSF